MGVYLPVYFLKCAITGDTDKINVAPHLIIMVHFVKCLHVKAGRLSNHTYFHWSRWVLLVVHWFTHPSSHHRPTGLLVCAR